MTQSQLQHISFTFYWPDALKRRQRPSFWVILQMLLLCGVDENPPSLRVWEAALMDPGLCFCCSHFPACLLPSALITKGIKTDKQCKSISQSPLEWICATFQVISESMLPPRKRACLALKSRCRRHRLCSSCRGKGSIPLGQAPTHLRSHAEFKKCSQQ